MTVTISMRAEHRVGIVAADGDIDAASVAVLESRIFDAVGTGSQVVVVDLSRVTFMDSAGITALLEGRRLANAQGKRYAVFGAAGSVRQILETTGVWPRLCGME